MTHAMAIIAPDRSRHREEVFDLVCKTFSHGGYFEFLDYCRNGYVEHSGYSWESSRIGLLDGRIVTHWGVWDYRMRIGTARVRVGGIGLVATHGEHRKRGLMDRTARVAIEGMRRSGFDMTLLFGIRDFYHRFGYVRAWAPTTYFVNAADLPKDPPQVRPRRFPGHHRDGLAALYNRENATRTGTAVRPTYLRNRKPGSWQAYLWTDGRGPASGYVVVRRDGNNMECLDFAGQAEQVLRVLARLARKFHCQEVRFSGLHYESELAKRLRRSTCRTETRYVRAGSAMVRTLNLRGTLTKMAGELSRRLRASHLAGWRGELLIEDARETVALAIGNGRADVISVHGCKQRPYGQASRGTAGHAIRGGEGIARLLIGADDPAEVIKAGRMRVSGQAAELADVLFPNQHPALSAWDGF